VDGCVDPDCACPSEPRCACPVRPRILTLTQDDRPGESLKSAFTRLLDAWKKLRRMKRWKSLVSSGITSLEVTRNATTGAWHPHLHAILDVHWYPQGELLEDWRAALGATGLAIGGARIEEAGMRKQHVAGCGDHKGCRCPRVPVADQAGSGVDEVIKYFGKGIELARTSSTEDLRELLEWMRGVRMLRPFGEIYGKTNLNDDEEPTVEEADGDEFLDVQTGEIVPRRDLVFRADSSSQASGWRLMAEQWRGTHQFRRQDFEDPGPRAPPPRPVNTDR